MSKNSSINLAPASAGQTSFPHKNPKLSPVRSHRTIPSTRHLSPPHSPHPPFKTPSPSPPSAPPNLNHLPSSYGGAMPIVLENSLHSSKFDSDIASPLSSACGCSSSGPSSISMPPLVSCNDPGDAIRRIIGSNGSLAISDLRAIQRLGSGDIGSVYLAEIKTCGGGGGKVLVAAKVMDKEELEGRNKSARAKTEREILEMLDHPFLPKLYGCAENEKLSCLLTEFCPGGDLHLLRQRQPGKRFHEKAVRFYAAELVVALEYLHVLGVIYRDLKPENVLVRSDGHIMLTDFDLSLKSEYGCSPTAQFVRGPRSSFSSPSPSPASTHTNRSGHCSFRNCIVPAVSCFNSKPSSRKKKAPHNAGMEFVAEPVDLRSMSFVGTHEYLAPEIVAGEGHGSAVDWWTLGVFIYELLYGGTPFKGVNEDRTLANILARGLEFPKEPAVSGAARELITGLLLKDPGKRLGSMTGAAAVKRHSFFDGVNWALLRCEVPPHVPAKFSVDAGSSGELSDDSSSERPVDYY